MHYANLQLLATNANLLTEATTRKVTFQVQVVQSPEGTALNGIPTQYDLRPVEQFRKDLSAGNLGWPDLIQFGQLLTDALFPAGTTARDLLERSVVSTRAQGLGLRLYLSLDRLLGNVPWECLLLNLKGGNPTSTDFLALMPNISIVRYQSATKPQFPIEANLPARILVALASPKTLPALDVSQERGIIEKALRDRPEAQPKYHANATRAVLQETEPAHIFHFSGHGTFDLDMTAAPGVMQGESRLFFEDAQQAGDGVLASEVALNLRARGARVALLNACQTGELDRVNVWGSAATAMLTADLGAVIGMQFKVGDASAAVFAGAFYESLIAGEPIDQAVSKGRQAVAATSDLRGWCTPVLYLNTPDGVVFPEFASSRELQDNQVRLPLLDFAPFIRQQAADFVGRDWLFQEVDAWLASPTGARYFLIQGEPGSGKTAIAVRLCQFSHGAAPPPPGTAQLSPDFLSAWHFCRVEESLWTNPLSFTKSLAYRLAERYFPFRQALLQSLYSPLGQASFVNLVREPLDALFRADPDKNIVILIDSLHEAVQDQGLSIVKLISELQTLSRRVRFIVTSWPQVKVLENVADTDVHVLDLGHSKWQTRSRDDVRDYALRMIPRSTIEARFAPDMTRELFAAAMRDKSEGNFLYANALLKALEASPEFITAQRVSQFPTGLTSLYRTLLPRLVGQGAAWQQNSPIVGTLAVAQAALTEAQIAGVVEQSEPETRGVLGALRPFLDVDEKLPYAERAYEIYHRSFADFVLDSDRAGEFWCEEQSQHRRIADYYLKESTGGWDDCDKQDCGCESDDCDDALAHCAHYGLRYTATHLARTVALTKPQARHELAQRLVALVTDHDFTQMHLARLNEDWNALQEDLTRALNAAVADRPPGSLPLVVTAARADVAFARTHLNPRTIFERADAGDITAAERRLLLFNCEPIWRQTALLAAVWLAIPAQHNTAEEQARWDQAIALRNRVAPSLAEHPTFRLLLQRCDAALGLAAMPELPPLQPPPIREDAHALVLNLGAQDAEGMGLSEGVARINLNIADNERVVYVAERDAPLLVSFAYHSSMQGSTEGTALFQEYLAIQSSNNYVQYRTEVLRKVLEACLAHPDQMWLQAQLREIVAGVLAVSAVDFEEGVPLAVLAIRAAAGQADALAQLQAWWKTEEEAAQGLQDERGKADSLSLHRRRLAALAECLARLPNLSNAPGFLAFAAERPSMKAAARQGMLADWSNLTPAQQCSAALLRYALDLPRGYAGFQSPACLTMAEAIRVCGFENVPFAEHITLLRSALWDAHKAAHNIQDSTFCARTTARFNAMTLRWWQPAGFDVVSAVKRMQQDRSTPEFSALHIRGEGYQWRNWLSEKAPLPESLRNASTLQELATAYFRPQQEFERMNTSTSPQTMVTEDGQVVEVINVPDGKFTSYIAARFAAELLVVPGLSDLERARLIQSLVPLAVVNPTAVDTVLMRLLLAAAPLMDSATLNALAPTVPEPKHEGGSGTTYGRVTGITMDTLVGGNAKANLKIDKGGASGQVTGAVIDSL